MTTTTPTIAWRGAPSTEGGVTAREFTVEGERDVITGVMWSPPQIPAGSPLVLIGHGGGAHKQGATVVPNGRGFVLEHGITAVCIDAPGHGERGGALGRTPEYYALWADAQQMTDHATSDWRRVLTALLETGSFDPDRVGWSGMSMGSMVGVPYVAAEPRIRAAALGLCGTSGDTPGRGTIGQVLIHAAPLIFMLQWDDERFMREGAFHLFEMLGSRDKRLVAHLGAHGEMPPEGRAQARAFLAGRLTA
ncbi:MAG: alpha/beta hydrolase [Dehalococcoidia bacterium]